MLDTTVATVTYFAECSLERWKSLCATKPTIRPIHNLRIKVLGALVTYAVDKSLIVIPIAPARPPHSPPISKAARTQNTLPKWNIVLSVPTGMSILINVAPT